MSLSSRGSVSNLDDDNEKLPIAVYRRIAGVSEHAGRLGSQTSRLVGEGSERVVLKPSLVSHL